MVYPNQRAPSGAPLQEPPSWLEEAVEKEYLPSKFLELVSTIIVTELKIVSVKASRPHNEERNKQGYTPTQSKIGGYSASIKKNMRNLAKLYADNAVFLYENHFELFKLIWVFLNEELQLPNREIELVPSLKELEEEEAFREFKKYKDSKISSH